MEFELSREEVLKIAKECGFFITDEGSIRATEHFASAIYSKGFSAGAEDMRKENKG